ncbi:hypothetical protein [Comamonas kerstersii]|nr:hypothetical protein [Comamonas kerstersii]
MLLQQKALGAMPRAFFIALLQKELPALMNAYFQVENILKPR